MMGDYAVWGQTKAAVGKLWNSVRVAIRSPRKLELIGTIRTLMVCGIGALGMYVSAWLIARTLRSYIDAGATFNDIAVLVLGGIMGGAAVTAIFCLLVFHAFSFFETATLPQAIRLGEAMRMLHAKTHHESKAALKYYRIDVFRAKGVIGEDVEKNVPCKLISTFLSPWFFNGDQHAAFGSNNHCCDFAQIQKIIDDNKGKWGISNASSSGTADDVIALERKLVDMNEKYQNRTKDYTAASGREGRLKKQIEEVESHMAVLVELANKVTNEVKPPRDITEGEVKAKYLAIGKIYGIDKAPKAYVDIFRHNMPKEIINWGGAPKQGSTDTKT